MDNIWQDISSKQPWRCEVCGSGYAEYINGCVHCWNVGLRSRVEQVPTERTERWNQQHRQMVEEEIQRGIRDR